MLFGPLKRLKSTRTLHLSLFHSKRMSTTSPTSTMTSQATGKPTENRPEFKRLNQTVYLSEPDPKARTNSNNNKSYPDAVPPRVILLFGWMDAPFRIVEKYSTPYRERFPQAKILIKLSRGDHYFQGKDQQARALDSLVGYLEKEGDLILARASADITAPAHSYPSILSQLSQREQARRLLNLESQKLESNTKDLTLNKDTLSRLQNEVDNDRLKDSTVTLIEKSELQESVIEGEKKQESHQRSSQSQPYGFIIHSFSDGGAGNQSKFIIRANLKQSSIFPKLRAQIFDCSVGNTSASSGSTAFSLPLLKRSRLLFYLVKSFLYVFISMALFIKRLIGRPTRSDILRRALNNINNYHSLLKNSTLKVPGNQSSQLQLPPRLYLYSKNDQLIDWKAVESHANDLAVEKGLTRPLLIEMEKPESGFGYQGSGQEGVIGPGSRRTGNQAESLDHKDRELGPGPNPNSNFARGVLEMRRWETPAHCQLARVDHDGYWRKGVDEFLGEALKE